MTSWFFIMMAGKSLVIASLALLLAMALSKRAAADRSMVLRVGAGLLLALPLIDLAFPVLQIEAFAAPAPLVSHMSAAEMERLLALAATLPPVEPSIWDDPAPLILILWAAGAVAVLARLLAGVMTLRRWTRGAVPVADSVWLNALERARIGCGAPEGLRLMVSERVPAPMGWGWQRPTILIDYDTLAEPEEAEAILAHEVAHVARRDWPALMMTRIVTALFWFNPLVWRLAREAVQQAEEAADAHAARMVEPVRYAETLLSWSQIGRGPAVPANSIAPGARALTRRVKAVLDKSMLERSAGSRLAIAATLLCVGVAAPVAAMELVEASRPAQTSAAHEPLALAAVQAPRAAAAPTAPSAPAEPAAAPEAPQAPQAPAAPLGESLQALHEVLPQIPAMVRESLKSADPEVIALMVRRAHGLSEAQLRAALEQVRAAGPQLEAAAMQLNAADLANIEARVRASMPDPAVIEAQVRRSLIVSADSLRRGAEGMEAGAARMEQQARRFRDRSEQERIIAEERARGHQVTHEELIDAAEGMDEGARGMREGAREMRDNARHMADGDDD
jgi:bla regulator protein blaR1